MNDTFLRNRGDYHNLKAYKKVECIYDITSAETELKLTNVARASLKELLEDYKDYLRVRGLELWAFESEKAQQTRRACAAHNDTAYYIDAIKVRSDETIANIAITLLYQADVLLRKLIESMERRFVQEGGVREKMTQARLAWRKKNLGY